MKREYEHQKMRQERKERFLRRYFVKSNCENIEWRVIQNGGDYERMGAGEDSLRSKFVVVLLMKGVVLEPMLDPPGVVRKMKYLTEKADTTERVWVEKLDTWYGEQTGRAKKHVPPGGNEFRVKTGLPSIIEESMIGLGIALMEVTNLKIYNLARVGRKKIKKVKNLVLVRCKEGVSVIDCRNGKIREMELDEYLSSDLIFKRKGLTGLILGIGQHKNGFGIGPGKSSITANGKVFKVVFALEGLCAATIHSQNKA